MADCIRFMLNGELREVAGIPPTMTVLQYLRWTEKLTGTKEGCAEGDCGACTVMVGRLEGGKVDMLAINACIAFLPTLDGRAVFSVEYLKKEKLHPVQQAMVDCHASQCGFCTPGFVMSLATLAHNKKSPSDCEIQDAIAGNLCRCTGYRPILDAARKSCAKGAPVEVDVASLKKLQRDKAFIYEGGGQKFIAPVTAEELATAFSQYPDATLLAGGTDVGLWVTKKHRVLNTIIYTGNVGALQQIRKTPQGLEIGGAVSYSHAFELLAAYDESFEELLRRLGSVQIRNSGTVGGNIANGSPIGDGMPPLIALNAKIVLRSAAGARALALEDYFIAYGKQDRKPGEFLEKVIVPAKPKNVLFKTYKISKRFDQDISAVCGAFALTVEKGVVTEARIAFGGVAATPKCAAKTEQFLKGKRWTEETAQQAMDVMAQDYAPISDMRASGDYRQQVAQNLLYRFYLETAEPDTETRVYGYGS